MPHAVNAALILSSFAPPAPTCPDGALGTAPEAPLGGAPFGCPLGASSPAADKHSWIFFWLGSVLPPAAATELELAVELVDDVALLSPPHPVANPATASAATPQLAARHPDLVGFFT